MKLTAQILGSFFMAKPIIYLTLQWEIPLQINMTIDERM